MNIDWQCMTVEGGTGGAGGGEVHLVRAAARGSWRLAEVPGAEHMIHFPAHSSVQQQLERSRRPYLPKRRSAKVDRSNGDAPVVRRSATISPITLENLKPCPEHALRISTFAASGCRSMMK